MQYILIAKTCIIVIIILLIFLFFFRFSLKEKTMKIGSMAKNKLLVSMQKSQVGYFNYDSIDSYLTQYGVKFMYGDKLNPISYFGIKFILAFLFSIIGFNIEGFLLGIGLWILGYFAFDIMINVSNVRDNENMTMDIMAMYDTLRLQTKANVFLLTALSECYICVRSARLKAALLQLTSDIINKTDIEKALDKFNQQFKNSYINTFCIIIKQSLESGKSVQILEDMSNQIVDVQHAIDLKEKESFDRLMSFFQFLYFIGIVALCIYFLCIEIGKGLYSL